MRKYETLELNTGFDRDFHSNGHEAESVVFIGV